MPANCVRFEDLEFIHTSHNAGLKKVFLASGDVMSNLAQVAYGKLLPGEKIAEHLHASMEEFFYFLKGNGVYVINDVEYFVEANSFVYIPARTNHSLISNGSECLEFVYFGVAVIENNDR